MFVNNEIHTYESEKKGSFRRLLSAVLALSLFSTSISVSFAGGENIGHGAIPKKGVVVVNPPVKHTTPETIDQIIELIQRNFHLELPEEEIAIEGGIHAMGTLSTASKPDRKESGSPPFSNEYLSEHKKYFLEVVKGYRSAEQKIRTTSMNIYNQWIYLELYKIRRWEYLMINYAKLLGQDQTITGEEAASIFQDTIPVEKLTHSPHPAKLLAELLKIDETVTGEEEAANIPQYITYSPHLQELHTSLVKKLSEQTPEDKQDAVEYMRGLTESNYLALAAIEQRRKFARERFSKKSTELKKELKTLEQKAMVVGSSAILQTSVFKKSVAPHIVDEALPTQQKLENANDAYLNKLNTFLETKRKRKITDLVDYLNYQGMVDLHKDYIEHLESDRARRFRARIEEAFPKGIAELRSHLEKVLSEHLEDIVAFNTAANITIENTSSIQDMRHYYSWLIRIRTEVGIHYLITKQFPYLAHNAAESINNMASKELKTRSSVRVWNSVKLLGLFLLWPLLRVGNKYTAFFGEKILHGLRGGSILAKAKLFGGLARLTSLEYEEWRRIQKLAMTNVEGVGLTDMVQAEVAFKSFRINAIISGALFGASAFTGGMFWREVGKNTRPPIIKNSVADVWNGRPIGYGKIYNRKLARRGKAAFAHLGRGNFKAFAGHVPRLAHYSAAQAIQVPTVFLAGLQPMIRVVLVSLPWYLYEAIVLASIIALMSVTISIYLTAAGVQSFSWVYRQLGLEPPAYWQLNELDKDAWLRREAFLEYTRILHQARTFIALLHKNIQDSKEALKYRKELSVEDKAEHKIMIQEAQTAINDILESHLVQWYMYRETRDIRSSFFKEKGIGVLAEPNIQKPVRLTIFMQRVPGNNDSIIHHSMSVGDVEHTFHRKGMKADFGMSKENLKALADQLDKLKTKFGYHYDQIIN